jgi:hypothetical protein
MRKNAGQYSGTGLGSPVQLGNDRASIEPDTAQVGRSQDADRGVLR